MTIDALARRSRFAVAAMLVLGVLGCGGARKVAVLDESATRRAAPPPRPAPWVPPPVEKTASGVVDTGVQLDFAQPMSERQIQDNLPNVRKQLREAYPDLPDAQRQRLLKQAEDAMRRGGGVLLSPTLL